MDSSSHPRRRNRLGGPPEGTTRPPAAPADQIVADAEDVLADAWLHVLIELRDRSQAKARGADVRCERARRALDAALVRREPGPIAAAHADVEQTLMAAGAAHDRLAQAEHGLTTELERLWWRSAQRGVEACVARNGTPQAGGQGEPPADLPAPASPCPPVRPSRISQLSRWAVPWMSAVAASLAAAGLRK